jgi:predicted P-loop ATPase
MNADDDAKVTKLDPAELAKHRRLPDHPSKVPATAVGTPPSADSLDDAKRPERAVERLLVRGRHGAPRADRTNLRTILARDSRVAGRIWLDSFRETTMLTEGEEARPLSDTDVTRLGSFIERVYALYAPTQRIHEVVDWIAKENQRNPLVEWLDGLQWDGVPRLGHWLARGVGAADDPLNASIGRRFLIQAVARARVPGCAAHTVLILAGPQGARKSTVLRELFGADYYADASLDITDRRTNLVIAQSWAVEFAELDGLAGRNLRAVKAYLSRPEDPFVPPYGRRAITLKRHVVFVGTTNDWTFLNDPSGSRRFWPVQVGEIDVPWVGANRHQLWAEAAHLHATGEQWHLTANEEALRVERADDFSADDPWTPLIEEWARSHPGNVAYTHVLMREVLGIRADQMARGAEMRVAEVLRALGFTKGNRHRAVGTRAYPYYPPGWSEPGAE